MLRIAFIIRDNGYNFKPFRNHPLVTLYLLTILEQHFGEKVRLSAVDLRGVEEENLIYHVPENDIFLYSVASPDYFDIKDVIEAIRSFYPEAKHIAGGPHINIFPEQSAELFDSIIMGEGEDSIIKLTNDILRNDLKPVYKQEKPIILDSYPYPNRKYLPKSALVDKGLLCDKHFDLRGTSVIFSRGCPFDCRFCGNRKLMFGPVRYRSPHLVTEEIEYLKSEYKVEALALKDDNAIPLDPRIAKPFLEAIARTNIKWRGQSRANGIHPDMVKLAKDAGCVEIGIGIESVSPVSLKLVNKNIDLDKAKEYIRLLHKVGINVRLHFICGLPGEPPDIIKRTLEFIEEANPRNVLFTLFCPMPGSAMYDHAERFGIKLITTDWRKYRAVFGRFDAAEEPFMVYEYNEVTPWGEGMSNGRILQNYIELQTILRERRLNF